MSQACRDLDAKLADPAWIRVVEHARVTLPPAQLDDATLRELAGACAAPETLALLVRLVYQHAKSRPHERPIAARLVTAASQSQFALEDWVAAALYFHAWLDERTRTADLGSMLEYLHCCAASPDARQPGQTLRAVAEDMLRTQGYEG